jgi:hypothetical protein
MTTYWYEIKTPKFIKDLWAYSVLVHEYQQEECVSVYWIKVGRSEQKLVWFVQKALHVSILPLFQGNYQPCQVPEWLLPYLIRALSEARAGFELPEPLSHQVPVGVWGEIPEPGAESSEEGSVFPDLYQQHQLGARIVSALEASLSLGCYYDERGDMIPPFSARWLENLYISATLGTMSALTPSERHFRDALERERNPWTGLQVWDPELLGENLTRTILEVLRERRS